MTNTAAAELLKGDAIAAGLHARTCDGDYAQCPTCDYAEAECDRAMAVAERMAFMWAYETNDEHREEMEREDALFGRGW